MAGQITTRAFAKWAATTPMPSLQAFTTQRAGLLAVLKPLVPDVWSRMATVTWAGKPRERTVYTYAQWLANHERSHFKQVERIANAMHKGFPSGNYLSIHLNRTRMNKVFFTLLKKNSGRLPPAEAKKITGPQIAMSTAQKMKLNEEG